MKLYKYLLMSSFGFYCLVYPGSIFQLVTNQVSADQEWMATAMLVDVGIAALLWLVVNYDFKKAVLSAIALLGLGFAVETLGETTGFPFGSYVYTAALYPKLWSVPIAILFAWLMIIVSSYFTARLILSWAKPGANIHTLVIFSTLLTVSSDLLMEPVAFHVHSYWLWIGDQNSGYYGVPLSNFIAWTVISYIMVWVLIYIIKDKKTVFPLEISPLRYHFVPPMLYLMNLMMFASLNISNQFYLAGVIGIVVGVPCVFLLLRGVALRLPLKPRNIT